MALTDDLISYWQLDETSGTRVDAHASNDLTDNNTVGYDTGIISNAADFVQANSEYLSKTSNTELQTGDIDFTVAFWCRTPNPAGNQVAASKWGGSTNEWRIYTSLGNLGMIVGGGYAGFGSGQACGFSEWHHFVCWHDSVNNQIGVCRDAGTPDVLSHSGGCTAGDSPFKLGAGDLDYWNGEIDEVGFWKRVLTSDERNDLYNGGSGLAYSSFGGGGVIGPILRGRVLTPGRIFGGSVLC